jgi:hypothetical protein
MELREAEAMATIGQDRRFPFRLHQLLDSTEDKADKSRIVSWLPGGKSFRVHDKAAFAHIILPHFFGTSKYRSFQRNVNLWGFHTVPKGPEKGSCSHPMFQKGLPDLCHTMERVPVKRIGAKRSQVLSKGCGSIMRQAGFNYLLGSNIQVGSARGNPIDVSNLTSLLNTINVRNSLRGFSPVDGNVEMTRLLLGSRHAGHASCRLNDISPLVLNSLAFPGLVANGTDMITNFAQAAAARGAAASFAQRTNDGGEAQGTAAMAAEEALRFLLNVQY